MLLRAVIHSISTSNHNNTRMGHSLMRCNSFYFYIKPQRGLGIVALLLSCNSFYFYIKPQQPGYASCYGSAVIHSISTSNHNDKPDLLLYDNAVIHSISTSNHNASATPVSRRVAVIHSISTSNHNITPFDTKEFQL